MFKGLKMLAVGVAAVCLSLGAAHAETRVEGGGATFPKPLYLKWIAAFNEKNSDIKVNYNPQGSGFGISHITDRTLTYGGSDAPMKDTELAAAPAKILHVPMVAGPVVVVYHLSGLSAPLKLNGEVISGIYMGQITSWNDPKIQALNAGVSLPEKDILVAHRSDASGTSNIFTDYLCKVSKEWNEKYHSGTDIKWPLGIAAPKNDGVAGMVSKYDGAIGYVEWAFAQSKKIPTATLVNKDGKEVVASIAGVEAAAAVSTVPPDMRVSITDASGSEAYPICGFTYVLVYQDLSYLKDKALAQALLKYLNWCATDGQATANELGYAKLSPDLQKKAIEELKSITFEGKPVLE